MATELGKHIGDTWGQLVALMFKLAVPFTFKTLESGAQTSIFCAVDESVSDQSGTIEPILFFSLLL